jgi:hypothetical protein
VPFSNKKWFKGTFIWKYYPNHQSTGRLNNKDCTSQNKPSDAIIEKCYLMSAK